MPGVVIPQRLLNCLNRIICALNVHNVSYNNPGYFTKIYSSVASASSACFIYGLHERLECLFYTRFTRALRVPVLYTVYTSASSAYFIHGLYECFECLFYTRFIRVPRVPVLYTVYTSASSACFIHGLYECLEFLEKLEKLIRSE